MTVAQHRALVVKALRNARKQHRTLQTRSEVLERVLDRLIQRKTIVTPSQMGGVVKAWDGVRAQMPAVEKSLADAISTSGF